MDTVMTPPPIRTADNAFANHTMRSRAPKIIRETAHINDDFPPQVKAQLEALAAGMESDRPVPPLVTSAPDHAHWRSAYLAHDGDTWLDTEWFYAETFYFRHIVEITGWFETGRDPYAPKKREELDTPALWRALDQALTTRDADVPSDHKLTDLIEAALWGNSIDLSYAQAAAHGTTRDPSDLLIDDTSTVVDHLHATQLNGHIDIIADNAGTELALDLVLVDALLDGWTDNVRLHIKQHPTFVSDTIRTDVLDFLTLLRARPNSAQRALGDRLSAALAEGALELIPDWFWNSSHFLWQHPNLNDLFRGSSLVISKGDANYRRLLGDAFWNATTPFSEVVAYLPAPTLALRTLKSDPIVGLKAGIAARLDAEDDKWRSNGKRGVIQFKKG